MAEPNIEQGEGQRPPGNGGEVPDDLDALKAELAKATKQIGQLINENKASKADKAKLAEGLKRWNRIAADHGIEPDDLATLLAERSKAELAKARDTGEVDKLLENQRKTLEAKRAEVEEELGKAKTLNNALLIDAAIDSGLERVKVKPSLKKAAFALHRPKAKVIQDPDSTYGVRAVVEIGDGSHLTIEDYLKNWAENDPDAGEFMIGNQSAGGGAPGSGGVGARLGFKKRLEMTALEKSQYIRANGIEAYNKLPWK
jgi:hypothetical protein